jgi:D-alanyl-lipoteichoic acid acyltransferase DltB (MBOAT superfamily)
MSVCSIEWLFALLLCSLLFFQLPGLRSRQILFTICNVGFVATLVPDLPAWFALALILGSGYGVAKLLTIRPRRIIVVAYLVIFVAAFLRLKQYEFLRLVLPESMLEKSVAVVGLSYLVFRQIHVIVDAYQGQIQNLTFFSYLNYQLNLFGITAGPIQRYPEFQEYWATMEPILTTEEILRSYLRIFLGVIKISLIARSCLGRYEGLANAVAATQPTDAFDTLWSFTKLFYLYPAFIYFNFSGYCDIVIGGAALFGLRMPENFDLPFLARNMIEYWTRWHRTLGFWIRDYVFIPTYRALVTWLPAYGTMWAIAAYFLALLLTGIWHGSTRNFVIFGFLNAIGVSAAKLWEVFLTSRLGRAGFKNYLKLQPMRVAAIVINFHFVCLTMFFFPQTLERSLTILRRVGESFR